MSTQEHSNNRKPETNTEAHTEPSPVPDDPSRFDPPAIDDGVGVVARPFCGYPREDVRWLEPGRIALGKVNMIAGDPGLGKSFMTLELAARVSRGEVGSVIGQAVILSAEDDPRDTLAPRLSAMCANLRRVHCIEGIRHAWGEHVDLISLDEDMDRLISALEQIARYGPIELIVVDPISAYMGRADSHNNAEVRKVLARLAQLAAITGAAVVCVTHLNKDSGSGKKAVYRAMGSLAFTAAARTVHLVTKYPTRNAQGDTLDDDPYAKDKRVVSMVKNNLGVQMPARVYIIHDGILTWLDEEHDVEADAFVNDRVSMEVGETKGDRAVEFLERMLDAGAQPAKVVFERGAALGLSESTLKRARDSMNALSYKHGSVWYWSRDGIDDAPLIRDAVEPELDEPPLDVGGHGEFGTS